MKKLCNASAIAAFLTAVCFTAVSCNKTPSESTLPVEKELGVSIELTSATETSVSVDITAEKDAEGYIYAIGEAGKLNEFQNGTMEGIQTQNDPTVKSASFDGLTKATDYTIYAQAFAGEEKGNVRQLVVTTEGEPDFDLTTTTRSSSELSSVPIPARWCTDTAAQMTSKRSKTVPSPPLRKSPTPQPIPSSSGVWSAVRSTRSSYRQ